MGARHYYASLYFKPETQDFERSSRPLILEPSRAQLNLAGGLGESG